MNTTPTVVFAAFFLATAIDKPPSTALAAAPQPAGLADVLRRAGEAVVRQAQEWTVVLADEECRQRAYKESASDWGPGRLGNMDGVVPTARRRWKAEMALVQLPEPDLPAVPWLDIRDVIEVDGKPLPDRKARLERLFQTDPNWKTTKPKEIVEENAKYNIGPARRTTNAPTIPLLVLYPPNQRRFTFEKVGEETVDRVAVWKIGFQEHRRPTLIRTIDAGADMPSAGTLWIDPDTGGVVRAEFRCGASSEVRLTVTYRPHPGFGLRLPAAMVEKVRGNDSQWVEGTCSYSRFRRFETGGRLLLPKSPDVN